MDILTLTPIAVEDLVSAVVVYHQGDRLRSIGSVWVELPLVTVVAIVGHIPRMNCVANHQERTLLGVEVDRPALVHLRVVLLEVLEGLCTHRAGLHLSRVRRGWHFGLGHSRSARGGDGFVFGDPPRVPLIQIRFRRMEKIVGLLKHFVPGAGVCVYAAEER